MSDCSNHPKEVAGISNMKVLAEKIGDLNYRTLARLLDHLSEKLKKDGEQDNKNRRPYLAQSLLNAASHINASTFWIENAYEISKPFMKSNPPQP